MTAKLFVVVAAVIVVVLLLLAKALSGGGTCTPPPTTTTTASPPPGPPTPPPSGSPVTLTGHQKAPVAGGNVELHANEYQSSAPFAIHSDGGPDFTISQSSINQTDVGAYPDLFVGRKGRFNSPNNPFPLQLATIQPGQVTTSVTGVEPPSANCAKWTHFYDIFITPTATQIQFQAPREELEILQGEAGTGGGSRIATNVNLDGKPYDIYMCNICVPHTVEYRPQSMTGSFSGDLLPFFQDSIRRGFAAPSWYLVDVENGFEVHSGNVVGLGDSSFGVQVKGTVFGNMGSGSTATRRSSR